ncbi:unnamed protein product [Heterosigma akashiwo]
MPRELRAARGLRPLPAHPSQAESPGGVSTTARPKWPRLASHSAGSARGQLLGTPGRRQGGARLFHPRPDVSLRRPVLASTPQGALRSPQAPRPSALRRRRPVRPSAPFRENLYVFTAPPMIASEEGLVWSLCPVCPGQAVRPSGSMNSAAFSGPEHTLGCTTVLVRT